MKYLFPLLTALFLGATSVGHAGQLTLRVDLRGQTISPAGVHVAGSFQSEAGFGADWNPATTALSDADQDSIYELTVTVPQGTYLYKFINGNTWPAAELPSVACGLDDGSGNVNRQVTVGPGPLRLPVVEFGGCNTQVRFAVNLTGQTVSPAGVHVIGNFQFLAGYGADHDPTTIPLLDPDNNGIYEVQLSLPAAGIFQYRFVNGNTLTAAEQVPAGCGVADGSGTLHRTLDATAAYNTPPTYCFGTCSVCGGGATANYPTYWWNDAVFYEVFVRSFYDSNADGQGDFAGLMAKLDYLNDGNPATTTDLGVTALWLMPMMASPSYHGYDVTNYKATEPDYGTMAQFEAFLAAAHARGIKVIIDLVLNHTSSQHPWFTSAASSPTSFFRDYYIWSPTNPGFNGPWGQTIWHPRNGSFYYGIFWSGMPDLNWSNRQVRSDLWDATRFWLNKGVDGYRLDAIKYLDENGTTLENTPETFAVLEEFHDTVRAANPNAFTIGEAWSPTPDVVPYVVNDRLDACFEFDLAGAILNSLNAGNPAGLRSQLNAVARSYPTLQYGTFLTNHDQNRALDVLGGDLNRMRQAAALYLTMPGVPFLYYGEEVGMQGSGPDEDKRKPMQWSAGPHAGFTTGTPWRAPNANFPQFNVDLMQADSASLLNHYKKLIRLRTTHEVLRRGYSLTATVSSPDVLAYARVHNGEAVLVLANFSINTLSGFTTTLPVSSLPAGTYQVSELYTGQAAGTVTVNAQGGFTAWAPTLLNLGANQTWILHLTPVATGLPHQPDPLALSLYPNPAADYVRLELSQSLTPRSQLKLYDLSGRLLLTTHFTGPRYELPTADLQPGTYFVRIQSGEMTATRRLAITR